ncbi:hypothetical protein SKAU_G00314050 [Synaphobranchus kaupii]|uniref:Sema domain-containing protein n=1 Tax=Synaphobranchus kaupii TaxID=118154 RepID=A0A9Q1ES80_SYNKA|nr:hypothetical protein SKAU_G00314050 [Synaphobranchus kaupii]
MRKIAVYSLPLLASALLLAGFIQMAVADDDDDDVTPRLSFAYNAKERSSKRFSVDGVFNYTSLLLSKQDETLYVGAREALFALSLSDISRGELRRNLTWSTPEKKREECRFKGKDLQTDCFNYVKILLRLNGTHLYVCGTYAFSPHLRLHLSGCDQSFLFPRNGLLGPQLCALNSLERDQVALRFLKKDSGVGKRSGVGGGGQGVADTLGAGSSEFRGPRWNNGIDFSTAREQNTSDFSLVKSGAGDVVTEDGRGRCPFNPEYKSTAVMVDPAFVGSAYLQESLPEGSVVGDDDKIYFFFSEVGKEFDFFDNTMVSRIARVCKLCALNSLERDQVALRFLKKDSGVGKRSGVGGGDKGLPTPWALGVASFGAALEQRHRFFDCQRTGPSACC